MTSREPTEENAMEQQYDKKRYVTKGMGWPLRLMNGAVSGLARIGISLQGSRVLEVKGRKSGEWRATPVNLLTVDGVQYLVAPRGHTQWVKNLRANPEGRLSIGRRVQTFHGVELADEEKPEILRRYLKKWAWEVGAFFGDDVKPDSPHSRLLEVAPGFPVFRITPS
ncbi:nitroreductase family deazaflavin-dependent oxidoreductase [Kribbella deserti]|uniref:Nitroreductase family deazaflavin-dependent oxidoreductase n=1 Tax=Kribbella deserti TaxID=1926257 RepID=A0ABV6QWV1_9ACTN